MKDCAPIIIFCYRRNIDDLISSLIKNEESSNSDLFIFSDGFKSENDKKEVIKLRESLKKIQGFKSVQIFEASKNKGLANSVIDGISNIINRFGYAIILEDDLVVSPYFLDFMNRSLRFYNNNKKIWSISGYSPKIPYLKNYEKDVYLSLRSSSWGWATWLDRWNKVDWSISDFEVLKKDGNKIQKFELAGNDMFKMLELQHLGKIDSWAIRWGYSQFVNSAYSVTPKISMTQNNGFQDNYGTHNSGTGTYWEVEISKSKIINIEAIFDYEIVHNFKKYHDIGFYTRCGYFLKKWGGYNLIKSLIGKYKLNN